MSDIHHAMREAFGVQVDLVDRLNVHGPGSTPWLQVTYRGKHVGWLPADTDPNTAMIQARRWLQQSRQIRREASRNNTPSLVSRLF